MNIWYEDGSRLNCFELNYDVNMQGSRHINIESALKVKMFEIWESLWTGIPTKPKK